MDLPGDGRQWLMVPAMCADSTHFVDSAGLNNGGPGITTFTLSPDGMSNVQRHYLPMLETVNEAIATLTA